MKANYIDDVLDSIESEYDLTSVAETRMSRVSFGLLVVDLITNGGIQSGGWYTMFGGEQSCKSTEVYNAMALAAGSEVPILTLNDFEGSLDLDYFENIYRTHGGKLSLDQLFGVRKKGGGWEIPPRIRTYSVDVAEKFFDSLAKLERMLPEKKYKEGQWWLVYEKDKQGKTEKMLGSSVNKVLTKATGKLYVPCAYAGPQALIAVDSYPAMLPESMDVDDPSNAMALQARMFSDNLKRVKGRLKSRGIAILGVNQLRLNPGARFGNPEYEPGGQALKFFSDVRLRMSAVSLSTMGVTGKGDVLQEESINGGTDEYRFVQIITQKNKLGGTPKQKVFARLWQSDDQGAARGFDPVYDVFQFLKLTDMISGSQNKLKISLPEFHEGDHKALTWKDFKMLILGNKSQITETLKRAGIKKPFRMVPKLRKYLENGKAFDWYNASRVGTNAGGDSEE